MSIEQEIYDKLVEQFGIGEICIKKWGKRKQLTWLEFIKTSLEVENSNIYTLCGFTEHSSLGIYFKREFPVIFMTKGFTPWLGFLLSLISKKRCSSCKLIKPVTEFSKNTSRSDNLNHGCRVCASKYNENNTENSKLYRLSTRDEHAKYNKEYRLNKPHVHRAANAKRRAIKLKATPKWADLEAIKEIYKNCPPGYHVDHEIPLQGELVCGLHVHKNLKPIPAAENLSKSNKYTVV